MRFLDWVGSLVRPSVRFVTGTICGCALALTYTYPFTHQPATRGPMSVARASLPGATIYEFEKEPAQNAVRRMVDLLTAGPEANRPIDRC